jgi:hypothetical protein
LVLRAQVEGNFIGNASSTLMRKKAVQDIGGYDDSLRARGAEGCEDQALYSLLAQKWNYTFVPQCLVAYRKHPWSMSFDDERMMRSQMLVLTDLRRLFPWLPGYLFARGMARIYEAGLTAALRHRRWGKVAEIVRDCAKINAMSLVLLFAFRIPPRVGGFCVRRLSKPAAIPQSRCVAQDEFWLVDRHEPRFSKPSVARAARASRGGQA